MTSSLPRARAALERGDAVFFVGSGLSARKGLGYPTWSALIRDLYLYCTGRIHIRFEDDERNELLALMDSAQLIEAADLLAAKLAQQDAQHVASSYFDDTFPTISQRASPDPVYDQLCRIRNVGYVTTNYDNEIHKHWTASHHQSIREFTWRSSNLFETTKHREFIVYAHGRVGPGQSEDIVLTRQDFDGIINNTAFRHWLQWLFTAKTVFFVGYSLSDPDIQSVLQFVKANTPGGERRPYWLVSAESVGSTLSGNVISGRFGVEVLTYKKIDPEHSGLKSYLVDLFDSIEVPQKRKADTSYIMAQLTDHEYRRQLQDLFTKAFPSALEGIVFYGSGMRSAGKPNDIDIALLTTDGEASNVKRAILSAQIVGTGLVDTVLSTCEQRFGVPIHTEALPVGDFFVRYTAGDPLIASMVVDGFDLLDREPFYSCRAIALANPSLSRRRLVRFLRFQRNFRLVRDFAYDDHRASFRKGGWAALFGLVVATLQAALALDGEEDWRLSDSARISRIDFVLSQARALYGGHPFMVEAASVATNYRLARDIRFCDIPPSSYAGLWDALGSFDDLYVEARLPSHPTGQALPLFTPGLRRSVERGELRAGGVESAGEPTVLDQSAPVIGLARADALIVERAFMTDLYNITSVRALRNPEELRGSTEEMPDVDDPIIEEMLHAASLPMRELITALRNVKRI